MSAADCGSADAGYRVDFPRILIYDQTTPQDTPEIQPAVVTATVALDVTGMHCDACADQITAQLKTIDGVQDLQVSFADKHADVTYDPDRVTPEAIIAAIGDVNAAYSANIVGADAPGSAHDTEVAGEQTH
jgi:copper chaperone CopZ